MSDNSVPGSGAGQGRRGAEDPAGTGGPAERPTDVMSHRRLAWSIWAGTGTLIVTAAAGLINYEFGHRILPAVLTFVIAVSVGTITGLIIYYAPRPHRHIRSARHAAEGMAGDDRPAGVAAVMAEPLNPPRSRPRAAG